ncbi:hypothetical protein 2210_scaffold709_00074 [Bacteriophage sp.]|nr:hypothetical protein 2210_scaffold709_00074 [Bacteriophage sp.]
MSFSVNWYVWKFAFIFPRSTLKKKSLSALIPIKMTFAFTGFRRYMT